MATDKLAEAKIKTLGNVMVDMKLDALVFKLVFTKGGAKAQTLGDGADTLAWSENQDTQQHTSRYVGRGVSIAARWMTR